MKKDVLCYPHINFSNPALIKGLSLFYDTIYRIVPEGIETNDHEDLSELIEHTNIVKKIDPTPYAQMASSNFMDKCKNWGAAALSVSADEEESFSKIHSDKIDEQVKNLFKDLGYDEVDNWFNIPSSLSSNCMLFLAQEISKSKNINLETDNWGAWTATNFFRSNGEIDDFLDYPRIIPQKVESPYALFSLTLHEIVPLEIEHIPTKKILEFREKRKDEIKNFRDQVFKTHEELKITEDTDTKIEVINTYLDELVHSLNDYKKSMDIIVREALYGGFKMLVFPSTVASGMASYEAILGSLGITIDGLYTLCSTQESIANLKKENGASALIDMNRKFSRYTGQRGGGNAGWHAWNCMEEYVCD